MSNEKVADWLFRYLPTAVRISIRVGLARVAQILSFHLSLSNWNVSIPRDRPLSSACPARV